MKPDIVRNNRLSALRIVAVYALFGAAWVFLSDELSLLLAWNMADPIMASIFIIATSITLYFMIIASFNKNRQMEEKLERNEERLKQALSASKMGVWEWDVKTNAVYWSPESFDIFGVESFSGTLESFTNLLHPDDAGYVMAADRKALADNIPNNMQYRIIRSDGRVRWISDHARPICNGEGTPQRQIGTVQDITERKLAEEEIKRKENLLQIIIDAVPALIAYVDSDFHYRLVNRSYSLWFNQSTDRICGCHVLDLLGDEYWKKIHPLLELAMSGEIVSFEAEIPYLSGEMRKLAATYIPDHDHDGRVHGVVVMAHDITRQKQDEESLRRYVQHVIVLEEKMRRQLAAELHDELGRDLTTLGLNFTIISNALSVESREKQGERVEDSACIIEEMSRTLRNLMIRLRPPVLDDYGLVAALRNYADQISKRTGIAVVVQLGEIEPRLSEEIETSLFRITQEALLNITKHAEAKCVTLKLEICEAGYKLSISDDGKGFDPLLMNKPDSNIGWGLTIMRERAESVGARFSLDSKPGRGTVVSVEIGED